jgi:hypothetical protein
MKKYVMISLPVATLIVGLISGWLASVHFYNQWISSYMRTCAYRSLAERFKALSELRAGDTNQTTQTLETLLDGDILGFGALIREIPADKRRLEDVRLIAAVRDYRAAHPWKADTYSDTIDNGVADVFALVGTNQTR